MAFWFKINQDIASSDGAHNVVFYSRHPSGLNLVQIHYDRRDAGGQFGVLMYVNGNVLWYTANTSSAPHMVDGSWHHFTFAWNYVDTLSSSLGKIFVDGVEAGSVRIDNYLNNNFPSGNWNQTFVHDGDANNLYSLSGFRIYQSNNVLDASMVGTIM